MHKLIIFDADGTLTTYREHAFHDAPLILLPNVAQRLGELSAAGVFLAVASNQRLGDWNGRSYTGAIVEARLQELAGLLPIPRRLMLSSHVNQERWYRPKPGTLIELLKMTGVSEKEALCVGDRDKDQEAAEAAGIDSAWAWDFFCLAGKGSRQESRLGTNPDHLAHSR